MQPGMSYSAALQAPYGYGSPRHVHRRGDHVENTWGAYGAPYNTRSTEHVNRPPRYDKGGSPQVKIAKPSWRRGEEEKRTSPPGERSLSPAAGSQRRYVCLLQLEVCAYVYPECLLCFSAVEGTMQEYLNQRLQVCTYADFTSIYKLT